MLVKLYDSNNNSGEFDYKVNKSNMLLMETRSRQKGFSKMDMARIEIVSKDQVIPVSMNAWSFFEHSLTFEKLCKMMDRPDGAAFVADFLEDFENTQTNDVALNLWLANEAMMLHGSGGLGM